jgi:hypothetical protein
MKAVRDNDVYRLTLYFFNLVERRLDGDRDYFEDICISFIIRVSRLY